MVWKFSNLQAQNNNRWIYNWRIWKSLLGFDGEMRKRHLDARKSQPYFALPKQIIYFRAPKVRKKNWDTAQNWPTIEIQFEGGNDML